MEAQQFPTFPPGRNILDATGLTTPPPETSSTLHIDQGFGIVDNNSKVEGSKIACLGVGYVGLHLALLFSEEHSVVAYDPDARRLRDIEPLVAGRRISLTSNAEDISSATYFLIAVPTSLSKDRTVDTTHLRAAVLLVEKYASKGSTVVVESSVAVGMTRSLLKDLMTRKSIKGGMSPERVDPGRCHPQFEHIPKIVSGLDDITPGSMSAISQLYRSVFHNVVEVSKPEVAEMTKLYENCQRMVCLGFTNELADACQSLSIDPFEVCKAAATKPFGYQSYNPGLGVGGHCIPVNPHYLLSNSDFPLLRAATEAMLNRPRLIAERIMSALTPDELASSALGSKVLIVGVGFKRGQAGLSNSPSVALMEYLQSDYGLSLEYIDPLVRQEALPQVQKMVDSDWQCDILDARFGMIVIALDQVGLDMSVIKNLKRAIVQNFATALPWGRLS